MTTQEVINLYSLHLLSFHEARVLLGLAPAYTTFTFKEDNKVVETPAILALIEVANKEN